MTKLTYRGTADKRASAVRGGMQMRVVRRMKKPTTYLKAYAALLAVFISTSYPTGLFGTNVAYLYGPKELGNIFQNSLELGLKISPFDELVRKHAAKNQMDWRFVASIIHAESRFQHDAVSPAGAVGLMQLMPIAARQHGLKAIAHPEENIRTGIQHFLWGKKNLKGVTLKDQISLALAAYNAGLGHVRDAQILAKKMGKNPRSWKHVGAMLLLLEHPNYYKDARYGYCDGTQAVQYVSKVMKQYDRYQEMFPKQPTALVKSLASKPAKTDV